jgi:hypothetical protein
MSRKVYVHIGAPKTGTTYLQDRLGRNLKQLAAHGVHVPTRSPFMSPGLFHFRAALDLLEQDWGGRPGHAAGSWEAMARRIRRQDGTVVFSHEILAPAARVHIERLKHDLAGSELHIVYSARDLARQAPAGWQESIKQGRRWSFRRYLRKVRSGAPWFARAFDLPAVLTAWGSGLPPEHVHVVTVPQAHAVVAEPTLLWRRFCTAFGIDPAWAPLDSDRTNTSLGAAETQVLRRLNVRLGRSARRDVTYDALVRGMLAQDVLSGRPSLPILLPPAFEPWAVERGEAWIEWLKGSGVDVVGDPQDLMPVPLADPDSYRHPDKPARRAERDAALDALAAMTAEAAARRDPGATLRGRVRRARQAYHL